MNSISRLLVSSVGFVSAVNLMHCTSSTRGEQTASLDKSIDPSAQGAMAGNLPRSAAPSGAAGVGAQLASSPRAGTDALRNTAGQPGKSSMMPRIADEDGGLPAATSVSRRSARGGAPSIQPAQYLGALAGPGTAAVDPSLQFYGTDLGYTYVHKGTQYILFGDSMTSPKYYCDNHSPYEDDAIARIPLQPPMGVPALDVITVRDHPEQYATQRVTLDGMPIPMGLSRTAATAWSDGVRAVAMIGHIELTTCAPGSQGDAGCDETAGLTCVRDLGRCEPPVGDSVRPCGGQHGTCGLGQECTIPEAGYCVDLTSSQYAGTPESVGFAIVRTSEFAVQREDAPEVFDTKYRYVSKKFHNSVARTVTRIGDTPDSDDYSPGHGTLLLWGRPGFFGERGGQAQMYLLKHTLPLPEADGKLVFEPDYFIGMDDTGAPRWSKIQRDAVALPMDGKINGDPSEPLVIPGVSTITWLGDPVRKWMMLYGGDFPDVLLLDTAAANQTRGPLRVRFADFPWGPWSPAQEYLSPGAPDKPGTPYGPGGFMFHTDCVDTSAAKCTKSDPVRPADSFLPGCPTITPQFDIGRMYGVNIIDPYTQPSGTGLDVTWNFSTWNPYGVLLMRSHVEP